MKAVYALFLRLEENQEIRIGTLETMEFEPGIYVYVGSGMKSVESRLARHFAEAENLHWHIDYLSKEAEPFDYLILPEDSEFECQLAEIAKSLGEPVPGFGSSDCDCGSHLFWLR